MQKKFSVHAFAFTGNINFIVYTYAYKGSKVIIKINSVNIVTKSIIFSFNQFTFICLYIELKLP